MARATKNEGPRTAEKTAFKVRSTAFGPNERIPTRYTADGDDISPPVAWSGLPEGTRSIALICDDPDAPTAQPWVHWVIFNISADRSELPVEIPTVEKLSEPSGALQGRNDFDRMGYGGPAPPPGHGTHHYHFKVYALDAALSVPAPATKEKLLRAMQGHELGSTELIGLYSR